MTGLLWHEAHPGQWHAHSRSGEVVAVMRREGRWCAVMVAPDDQMYVWSHETEDVRAAQVLANSRLMEMGW